MATETLEMQKGETHRINLQSRGASGLQLLSRCEKDGIVEINRITQTDTTGPINLGGAIPATFEIKAIGAGETKVTFYETRPWDKDFKEILAKEIMVIVK